MENLEKSLSQYFPATNNDVDWIQNPFMNQKKPAMLSMLEYEQLIEIKSMSYLKQKFESGSLNEFWIELKDEYPSLVETAIFTLLPCFVVLFFFRKNGVELEVKRLGFHKTQTIS